jgi:hypothetical protein
MSDPIEPRASIGDIGSEPSTRYILLDPSRIGEPVSPTVADPAAAAEAITAKHAALKRDGLDLGAAQGAVTPAGYGGFYRVYANGRIYWHATTGAREVHGGILSRYRAAGEFGTYPGTAERRFGFPTTDEVRTDDGRYPVSHFEWGAIFWLNGGLDLYGGFHAHWKSRKAALGPYPVSNLSTLEGKQAVFFAKGCAFTSSAIGSMVEGRFAAAAAGSPARIHPTATDALPLQLSFLLTRRQFNAVDVEFLARLWTDRLQLRPVGQNQDGIPIQVSVARVRDPLSDLGGFGINPDSIPVTVELGCRLAAGTRLVHNTSYDVVFALPGGARTAIYAPGAIVAHDSALSLASSRITGKHTTLRNGGLDLGPAQAATEYSGHGGYHRVYQSGRIYTHPSVGTFEVHGGILTRYLENGGPGIHPQTRRREFGFPVTDEIRSVDGRIPLSRFEWGAIYWHNGGIPLFGDFYRSYRDGHQGESGSLGPYPVTRQRSVGSAQAVYFPRGCLFQAPGIAAPIRGNLSTPSQDAPGEVLPDTVGPLPLDARFVLRRADWDALGRSTAVPQALWSNRLFLRPAGQAAGAISVTAAVAGVDDPLGDTGGFGIPPAHVPVTVRLQFTLPAGTRLVHGTAYDLLIHDGQHRMLASRAIVCRDPSLQRATEAITAKHAALRAGGLDLGPAQGAVQYAGYGGHFRVFERGRIYFHPTTGAHEVHGGILTRYLQEGGPGPHPRTGVRHFGFPTTDEIRSENGRYPVSHFEWGGIFWVNGGLAIHGDIYRMYTSDAAVPIGMGDPLSNHLAQDGDKELVHFENVCLFTVRDTPGVWGSFVRAPLIGTPGILSTSAGAALPVEIDTTVTAERWQQLGESADPIVRLWSGRLALRSVDQAHQVPVALATPEIRRHPSGRIQVIIRTRLPAGQALRDRTLYDLVFRRPGDGRVLRMKPHTVYAKTSWTNFGVLHATDIHVARRVDGFARTLRDAGRPESARELVNFNDALRDLIRYANRLHAEGRLDLIMATGDVVDYLFEADDHPRKGGNFEYFRRILLGQFAYPDRPDEPVEELRVPIFTTLGNHDYRRDPYTLLFNVDVPCWKDKEIAQFSSHNLVRADAIALQGGRKPTLHREVAYGMIRPVEPFFYDHHIGKRSYTVELGAHRLVMLDTGPDTGVVDSGWEALEVWWGSASEDQKTFAAGSPNSVGLDDAKLGLVRDALAAAGSQGLAMVGMHAPPLNPKRTEISHFLRETERASASELEMLHYLFRIEPFLVYDAGTGDFRLPSSIGELRRLWAMHPTWNVQGVPHFAQGDPQDMLDWGVSRREQERFLKLCAGVGAARAVDLVLFGHVHEQVEFRLQWDAAAQKLRYSTEFYAETPPDHYVSRRVAGWLQHEAVHPRFRAGAPPMGQPRLIRDDRQFWKEWKEVDVPPYAEPLASSPDPRRWWQRHRPLLMQTAPVGPIDVNQRRDTKQNPSRPGPALRGVRLISVRDNVIQSIRHVRSAEMASAGVMSEPEATLTPA